MGIQVRPIVYIFAGAVGGALAGRIARPYAHQFLGSKEESPAEDQSSESIDEQPGEITLMMDARGAVVGGAMAMAFRPFLGDFPKILLTMAFVVAFILNASRGTKYQEDVDKTVGKVAPGNVENLVG
ncbi:MAG: hypothetical protein U0822_05855 [Anaerolineae bacterium]